MLETNRKEGDVMLELSPYKAYTARIVYFCSKRSTFWDAAFVPKTRAYFLGISRPKNVNLTFRRGFRYVKTGAKSDSGKKRGFLGLLFARENRPYRIGLRPKSLHARTSPPARVPACELVMPVQVP
jgi:hypothetical protein